VAPAEQPCRATNVRWDLEVERPHQQRFRAADSCSRAARRLVRTGRRRGRGLRCLSKASANPAPSWCRAALGRCLLLGGSCCNQPGACDWSQTTGGGPALLRELQRLARRSSLVPSRRCWRSFADPSLESGRDAAGRAEGSLDRIRGGRPAARGCNTGHKRLDETKAPSSRASPRGRQQAFASEPTGSLSWPDRSLLSGTLATTKPRASPLQSQARQAERPARGRAAYNTPPPQIVPAGMISSNDFCRTGYHESRARWPGLESRRISSCPNRARARLRDAPS